MQLHILGIAGTFMGGLAALASELKFKVTGADANIYPPMSTQLEALGIQLSEGYGTESLASKPDCVVVGNVMRRGMPVIEALLDQDTPYMSGPEWLAKYVLSKKHVLAVSGTHGKTTTSSMLAWILEVAGLNPGFLIGGVPSNFTTSARIGGGQYFVVEADEYDSAFFDKRSKFIHYRPNTLIINNIEFDHADIFPNLAAIQTQFHHLLRTIPSKGLIVYPKADLNVQAVLEMGCWTPQSTVGFSEQASWTVKNSNASGSYFEVWFEKSKMGTVEWALIGQHNIANALAAIAAAHHIGVAPETALQALCSFKGVKRRMEVKGCASDVTIYDDFAHHPTAIKTTLQGLRAKVGDKARIVAIVDLRSNTMRAGHHKHELSSVFEDADDVYFYKTEDTQWNVEALLQAIQKPGNVFTQIPDMLLALKKAAIPGDNVIFMSNGGFSNSQMELLKLLA